MYTHTCMRLKEHEGDTVLGMFHRIILNAVFSLISQESLLLWMHIS